MLLAGENYNKEAKLSEKPFLHCKSWIREENFCLRVNTKANLQPKLKIKVAQNTYERKLDEWSLSMKTATKSSFENLQKQLPFKEIYVIYLEKTVKFTAKLLVFLKLQLSVKFIKLVTNIRFSYKHSIN